MVNSQEQQKPAGALIERVIESLLFGSRWLLVPLYFGLAVTLVVFAARALLEVINLFTIIDTANKPDLIVGVLSLVDLTLVANLLVMVILTSYETFVSRIDLEMGVDRPPWLGKLDAGTVKLKLLVSVVAVSSVHLLKVFFNITQYTGEQLLWLVVIHLTFVFSALLLTLVEKIASTIQHTHSKPTGDSRDE
jgi:uncharacterized protein (TIGR00645 family)